MRLFWKRCVWTLPCGGRSLHKLPCCAQRKRFARICEAERGTKARAALLMIMQGRSRRERVGRTDGSGGDAGKRQCAGGRRGGEGEDGSRPGSAQFRCEDCGFAVLCSNCVVRQRLLTSFHRIQVRCVAVFQSLRLTRTRRRRLPIVCGSASDRNSSAASCCSSLTTPGKHTLCLVNRRASQSCTPTGFIARPSASVAVTSQFTWRTKLKRRPLHSRHLPLQDGGHHRHPARPHCSRSRDLTNPASLSAHGAVLVRKPAVATSLLSLRIYRDLVLQVVSLMARLLYDLVHVSRTTSATTTARQCSRQIVRLSRNRIRFCCKSILAPG